MKAAVYFMLILFLAAPGFAQEKLTLSKSIEFALKNNPSIWATEKTLVAAQEKVKQAMGACLPALSLEGGYARTYQSPATTIFGGVPISFGIDEPANTLSYTLSLSQPLFTGGKLTSGLSLAMEGEKLSREDLRKASIELIFNVKNAYFSMLKVQKFVTLAQEAVETAREHLDQVKVSLSAEIATKADVLRAEVQLKSQEQNLIKAQNGLALAGCAFNHVLGRDLEEMIVLEKAEIKEKIPEIGYNLLLAEAYKWRPDWRRFKSSKKLSEANISLVRSDLFPSVALVSSIGSQNIDYTGRALQYNVNSWHIAASGKWIIFDGFSNLARVRESEANLKSLEASEELLRKSIALEVKEASLNLKDARERISVSGKAVDLAQENLRISNLRYKSGLGTNLEVLDAGTSFTKAELDLLEAEFDFELAKAMINKTVGKEIFAAGQKDDE